jgi:mycofactocin system glycosyltransferase
LPAGFRLQVDPRTRRHEADHLLVGGSPRHALRLSDRGAAVSGRLLAGEAIASSAEGALARRLVDAGIAHPVPPAAPTVTVEVVVPSYDDPTALTTCLQALGRDLAVTVVDDGSRDAMHMRTVVDRSGARLLRRDDNGGPAAARNAGAATTSADVIAFVDSDTTASAAAIHALSLHFADPCVVAVAPRIRPASAPAGGVIAAFASAASPLDQGADSGVVAPHRQVGYVPSTVLLVRRRAFEAVGGFDESLRYGEDVDLIWRLTGDGGVVRYAADVEVQHHEPEQWRRWLRRRFAYGTSAAALSQRHGARAVGLTMQPVPLAVAALLVARRPGAAAAVAVGTSGRVARRLNRAGVPALPTAAAAVISPAPAALAAARWVTQLWWPVLLGLAVISPRHRRAVGGTVIAAPAVTWLSRRPRLDPLRWTIATITDDVAYGLGVWRGCLRHRTAEPLLPRLR